MKRSKAGSRASSTSICDVRPSVLRSRAFLLPPSLCHISDGILMITLNCYLECTITTSQTFHTHTQTHPQIPETWMNVSLLKSFHLASYLFWHTLQTLHFCLPARFWLVAALMPLILKKKTTTLDVLSVDEVSFFKIGWSAVKTTIFSLRGHTHSARVRKRVLVWWSEKQTSLVLKLNVVPSLLWKS